MRLFAVLSVALVTGLYAAPAREDVDRALRMERSGQAEQARTLLAREAQSSSDPETLVAYAEFLDRYRDAGRIDAYRKAFESLPASAPAERKRNLARRLATLSILAGNSSDANKYLQAYRDAGGSGLDGYKPVAKDSAPPDPASDNYAAIPGPLLSFQRMAALSTDQEGEELLASLARNLVTNGYRATRGAETLEQTEYLKLLLQYLSQAREMAQMAGADRTLRIPACESTETASLLKILGFRLRGECGPEAVLETVNPSRAFLSIDSGFPLAELEHAYRRGESFSIPYDPNYLPVEFGKSYWLSGAKKVEGDFIDVFLADPSMARLYVALGKMHRPTAEALKSAIEVQRLKNFAHVLDFFGETMEIRDGKVVVPGGAAAENVWRDIVGAPPTDPVKFLQTLIEADDGWLAAYYDSMARIQPPGLQYFLSDGRLKRFYEGVRGKVTSPGPARPVFRANAELMLLTTRLHFNADGTPHIPGGTGSWQRLFVEHPHGKYDGKLTKSAAGWKTPEDVIEAMFALCRKAVENEPLKMFMAISNVDRKRAAPIQAATVDRLILSFPVAGDQFVLFGDSPSLSDASIIAYLDVISQINKQGNQVRRADTIGTLQGLLGLWQIFGRQDQIPAAEQDATFRKIIDAFAQKANDEQIFDAGREGVRILLAATKSSPDASPQDRLMQLLGGKPGPEEAYAHEQVVERMQSLFNQQRLISIKTLFDLADHLERVSRGESLNVAMANRLAAQISEVRLPRADLSTEESNAFVRGHWVERHVQDQRSLNLRRAVDNAQGRSDKLQEIRGELAAILRDSLVGLNYIYYSPPGAQLIRSNPLFVRTHDFLGIQGNSSWASPRLLASGWPSSGGGRLVGSLVGLPYALADAEQNFLIPSKRQALIWQDLAPQILLGATVPRWWGVDSSEMHWAALQLGLAEQLSAEACADAGLRATLVQLLERQVMPERRRLVAEAWAAGHAREGLEYLTPSEQFNLASRFRASQSGGDSSFGGPFLAELSRLASSDPAKYNDRLVADLFGMPHPKLSNSYLTEMLRLPLYPTLMGYSSRILAESWESTNLYWAALADELHMSPAQLNLRVPEWTKKALERIFATHLDDWPAVLRSMRIVGDDYRAQVKPGMLERVSASLDD